MECINCGKENDSNVTFCVECGRQIRGERIDYDDNNKKYYVQTLLLFVSIALIIVTSIATHLSFLNHELVFSGLLAFVTIVFALVDFRSTIKIFRFSFHLKPFLQILIGAPSLAVIVIYLAQYINNAFGLEPSNYFEGYDMYTSNMYIYGIVFVALVPGVFEELLFRGILFNHLLRLSTPRITIVITTILFAFIHFSFLSLLWLVIIGLYLGYLRLRYRTVLYGIFFHILYNSSIFFFEILLQK